ncbi:MAG TPA: protease inhibitor I42 family protein [Actinophytocola sp.]|uniref:protease inhibitor I42 family protein n=1 Tax=Actinophytocola sp. TaxID=1872138 RepID=UPI002DBF4282|nr:protease inhibitor I42 family protein [Actinophytocola sp.]HEU5471702.1 protease inhibitor I42 family protein [Actinophytocola sp.]
MLVHLTEANSDHPIELRKGDTVELRLPESPASDYRWRWRLPEGLRMITDEHVPGLPGNDPAAVSGQRRLAFDVHARGRLELRAELARPWESEAQQALTFTVHAQ